MPSAADRQLIDYAAVSNIHSFLFPLAMLAPPPVCLEESLKTRYFVIHGFSHLDGPGLEQFWIQPISPDLLASPDVPAELLVYLPCAEMPFDKRQHALSVLGFALSAQRLAADFQEPLPASQRPRRFRYAPLLHHDNPTPAEKSINIRIVALAFADRRHLVCDTAKTERDLCRARLALRRAREAARNEFPA